MSRKRDLPLALLDLVRRVSVRPIWEPRDLWVGAFLDTKKRRLYLLPLPTLGLVLELHRTRDPGPLDLS